MFMSAPSFDIAVRSMECEASSTFSLQKLVRHQTPILLFASAAEISEQEFRTTPDYISHGDTAAEHGSVRVTKSPLLRLDIITAGIGLHWPFLDCNCHYLTVQVGHHGGRLGSESSVTVTDDFRVFRRVPGPACVSNLKSGEETQRTR